MGRAPGERGKMRTRFLFSARRCFRSLPSIKSLELGIPLVRSRSKHAESAPKVFRPPSLRVDVSYFLCFTQTKEIGDVCTQATGRRSRLKTSVLKLSNNVKTGWS